MSLCKYKDAFGKPGEGAHQYRIFNFAIVDTLLTVLLAFVIAYFSGVSFVYVVPFTFVLGIVVHRLFCVRTTVDRMLFPNA
jgi:fatty acid desaturase